MRLAFYRGVSLTSKLIRFQSRGVYSHVGVLFDDGSIIEAWQDGGVLHNANIGTRHNPGTIVDIFELTAGIEEEEENRVKAFLIQQLGKKYDFRGVFQFLMLPRMFNDDNFQDKTHWFCSDLVYMAFHMGGFDLLKRAPRGRLSPVLLNYSPLLEFSHSEVTSSEV